MTNNGIIDQLQDLIIDREALMDGDHTHDAIYMKDIQALKAAISKIMESGNK